MDGRPDEVFEIRFFGRMWGSKGKVSDLTAHRLGEDAEEAIRKLDVEYKDVVVISARRITNHSEGVNK